MVDKKLVMIGISRKGESEFKIKIGANHGNIHCNNLGIRFWSDSRSGVYVSDGMQAHDRRRKCNRSDHNKD